MDTQKSMACVIELLEHAQFVSGWLLAYMQLLLTDPYMQTYPNSCLSPRAHSLVTSYVYPHLLLLALHTASNENWSGEEVWEQGAYEHCEGISNHALFDSYELLMRREDRDIRVGTKHGS